MTATKAATGKTATSATGAADRGAPPATRTGGSGGGRRFGPGMLTLAVVVALLAGFAGGMLAFGGLPGSGSPDDASAEAGFARDMTDHHAQAVAMGLIAYQRADAQGVRQMGYDIATGQQGQIGMMQQWLRDWGLSPNRPLGTEPMAWMPDGDAFTGFPMPGMASTEQMTALREAEGTEVDRLFLELMITHHLGGIHMVDGVLDLSDDPDVQFLAGIMKDGQQRELDALRNLLAAVPTE